MNIKPLITLLWAIFMTASFTQAHCITPKTDTPKNECEQDCNAQKDKKGGKWEEIESAKIGFFTTFIGITSEEAKEFWPIYNNYQEESRKLHKATRTSLRAIKTLSEKGKFSDVEMKKLIKEYLDNFEKEGELTKIYLEEFYKILPVEKVAKIFLAEEEFRVTMIKMWKKGENKGDGPKNGEKE